MSDYFHECRGERIAEFLNNPTFGPHIVSHIGPHIVAHMGPHIVPHFGPHIVAHIGPHIVPHQLPLGGLGRRSPSPRGRSPSPRGRSPS